MFSNLARLIAIVAFVLGLFNFLLGIAIATEMIGLIARSCWTARE